MNISYLRASQFARNVPHLQDDFIEFVCQIDHLFVGKLICIHHSYYYRLSENIFEANYGRPLAHLIQALLDGLLIEERVKRTDNWWQKLCNHSHS